MPVDLTKLSEDDLIELNRRIVERLQLIRSAKSLTQLARFSVGMMVEFDTDDGADGQRYRCTPESTDGNDRAASGRWRVSPSFLRVADALQAPTASGSRVVAMPPRRRD